MTTLLACDDLSIGYGRLAVGRGLNISITPGTVTAILGPNGAGKTTWLLTLSGFLPAISGSIMMSDGVVRRPSAQSMNAAGVVLVPDNRALFTQLNPVENLKLAARPHGIGVDGAMDLFPALKNRARLKVGSLSGGEQQMLAVARALVQGPKVLLIDEMSMGLAPIIVEGLIPIVRKVADDTGAAVVLVEQHVPLALSVADHALVLVHGNLVLDVPAAGLRERPELLEEAYLGKVGG